MTRVASSFSSTSTSTSTSTSAVRTFDQQTHRTNHPVVCVRVPPSTMYKPPRYRPGPGFSRDATAGRVSARAEPRGQGTSAPQARFSRTVGMQPRVTGSDNSETGVRRGEEINPGGAYRSTAREGAPGADQREVGMGQNQSMHGPSQEDARRGRVGGEANNSVALDHNELWVDPATSRRFVQAMLENNEPLVTYRAPRERSKWCYDDTLTKLSTDLKQGPSLARKEPSTKTSSKVSAHQLSSFLLPQYRSYSSPATCGSS